MPSLARSACRNTLSIQRGRNAINGHASGAEFLHPGNDSFLGFVRTIATLLENANRFDVVGGGPK